MPYADSEYALNNRVRNSRNIWVVPKGYSAFDMLLKELLRHNSFKSNSRDEVRRKCQIDPEGFFRAAEPYFPRELVENLLQFCLAGDWVQVESLVTDLRRSVWSNAKHHPISCIEFLWKNLEQVLSPKLSSHVVLVGPDGSGKTSVANHVATHLYHFPFKRCNIYEHRFGVIPTLSELKRKIWRSLNINYNKIPIPTPGTPRSGMNPEHSFIMGSLYVIYYSLDYWFGRIVLARLRSQGALVIFARYYYDYIYQKGYRNVPRFLISTMRLFVPTPDLLIYLNRSAQEIYDAKPELDKVEIEYQQALILEQVVNIKNAYIVDASQGLEKTVEIVARIIIDDWGKR